MKTILFWISVFVIFSCSTKNNTNSKKAVETLHEGREIPGYVITDSIKVFAKLEIKAYSIDSIMAYIIFQNEGKNAIDLYKPILPSDTLAENTFSVIGKDNEGLEHVSPPANNRYLFGNQRIAPGIIPEISSEHLLKFKPGEQLSFSINLAKHYNFRQTLSKGNTKEVSIGYVNLFPYIIEGKQIYMPYSEPGMNGKRPVYFIVDSKNDARKYERIKILLPSAGHL